MNRGNHESGSGLAQFCCDAAWKSHCCDIEKPPQRVCTQGAVPREDTRSPQINKCITITSTFIVELTRRRRTRGISSATRQRNFHEIKQSVSSTYSQLFRIPAVLDYFAWRPLKCATNTRNADALCCQSERWLTAVRHACSK